jgi:hypothetical protein
VVALEPHPNREQSMNAILNDGMNEVGELTEQELDAVAGGNTTNLLISAGVLVLEYLQCLDSIRPGACWGR